MNFFDINKINLFFDKSQLNAYIYYKQLYYKQILYIILYYKQIVKKIIIKSENKNSINKF